LGSGGIFYVGMRLPFLVGAVLVASAADTLAADWSAHYQFSQGVEANNNRALSPKPTGETYEFVTRLMFDTVAKLPTLRFEAYGDVSYRDLAGPGRPDSTAPMDNGLGFKVEKLDKLTKYFWAGSWRRQDATSAQAEDTGLVFVRGDINTYVMEGGFSQPLSPRDSMLWSVRGTSVDFTSVTGDPYVDIKTTGTWVRRLNPTTQMNSSVQLEWVARDDLANSESMIARAMTGLEYQVTKRLTAKGSIGVGYVNSTRDGNLLVPTVSESTAGWLADLLLTYRPFHATTLSFFATQSMAPNVVGQIDKRTSVGLSLRHVINPSSELLFSGDFSHQELLYSTLTHPSSADLFKATVTYGYRLSPEWQTRLSYRFAQREDDVDSAHSNSVFLSLVRDVTILP